LAEKQLNGSKGDLQMVVAEVIGLHPCLLTNSERLPKAVTANNTIILGLPNVSTQQDMQAGAVNGSGYL
jgi:hypothetical protein